MDDNREAVLDGLNDFEKRSTEISPLLEEYLQRIAKTGDTMFPWAKLKPLLKKKTELVLDEFYESCPTDNLPPLPNVENFKYSVLKNKILEALDLFQSAPFTIQRICELLTDPRKHYKHTDKFMRGLEKNVLVVSTVEPKTYVDHEVNNNHNANLIVNGLITGISNENDKVHDMQNSAAALKPSECVSQFENYDEIPASPSIVVTEISSASDNDKNDRQECEPVANLNSTNDCGMDINSFRGCSDSPLEECEPKQEHINDQSCDTCSLDDSSVNLKSSDLPLDNFSVFSSPPPKIASPLPSDETAAVIDKDFGGDTFGTNNCTSHIIDDPVNVAAVSPPQEYLSEKINNSSMVHDPGVLLECKDNSVVNNDEGSSISYKEETCEPVPEVDKCTNYNPMPEKDGEMLPPLPPDEVMLQDQHEDSLPVNTTEPTKVSDSDERSAIISQSISGHDVMDDSSGSGKLPDFIQDSTGTTDETESEAMEQD